MYPRYRRDGQSKKSKARDISEICTRDIAELHRRDTPPRSGRVRCTGAHTFLIWQVVKSSLNPVWNEDIEFEGSFGEFVTHGLQLAVWDKVMDQQYNPPR